MLKWLHCFIRRRFKTSKHSKVEMEKPKLIVFDLDYTLWPFWVDTDITSPIKKDKDEIVDGAGKKIAPFPEVPDLLTKLTNEGYALGVASRTEWPEGAKILLKLLDWEKYFTYKEIYPGRKTTHFQRMKEDSGFEYSEMIFFDDESRNITDLQGVGVMSILVTRDHGVTNSVVEDALREFSQRE